VRTRDIGALDRRFARCGGSFLHRSCGWWRTFSPYQFARPSIALLRIGPATFIHPTPNQTRSQVYAMKTKSPLLRLDRLLVAFATTALFAAAPHAQAEDTMTNTNDVSYFLPMWGGDGSYNVEEDGETMTTQASSSGGFTTMSSSPTTWNYDFGSATGTFTGSAASTTFLPAPPTGGGTARVRVGTQGGSFQLTSVAGFGSGSALVGTAATGGSVNKFSIYEWADPTPSFSMSFDMRLGGGDSGIWSFFAGNGASFTNNNAFGSTEVFSSLRMAYGASGALSVSNRSGTAWVALADTGIVRNENLNLSIFGNNTSGSTSYFFNDETYSLAANTWDLWVDGVRVAGVAKGALGGDININSFMFIGESSTSNTATISLDNFIYMNGLEPPPPPPASDDLYWSGGSGWVSTEPGSGGNGNWNNGDGGWDATKVANFGGSAGAVDVNTVSADAGIKFTTTGYTLSGGTITFGGASEAVNTIETDEPVTATISSTLAGSAGLTKEGSGILVLSGANTFSGGLFVGGGVLSIGSDGNLGNAANAVTLNGGSMRVTDALTLARNFVIGASGGTINTDGNNVTIGNISGGGALTKAGEGTLEAGDFDISANGLSVSAGTLVINPTGTRTLAAGGTIDGILEIGTAQRYNLGSGTFGGTGAIHLAATATALTTTGTAINAIINPELVLNSRGLGTFIAYLGALSGHSVTYNGIISGDSVLRFASSGGSGGAGLVVLNAQNTYTGATEINNTATAVVQLGVNDALPTSTGVTWGITQNSGFLDLNGFNQTVASIATAGTFVTGGATNSSATASTLTVNQSTSTTFGAALAGNLNVAKQGSGVLTLTNANPFTGTANITGGTLALARTDGEALTGLSGLTVGSGATLLISQNNQVRDAATVTLSGGTITRASGVSEVFGNLNLTDASFLNFGTGDIGTLSFGTYTPSALLTVQNFLPGNVLTFGSNLTTDISNTERFVFQGDFTSSWDGSTFTITAIPEPSTYAAAAGLLAMMLWPARRRLLKDVKSVLGLRVPMRDRLAAKRA